jgi:hypothetical protein
MEQQNLFAPTVFIDLFNEFKAEIKLPDAPKQGLVFNGITKDGIYYSAEALFEMLRTISAVYGRLAFKEDQKNDPDLLSQTFKELSKGYFEISGDAVFASSKENIAKLTKLAGETLKALEAFELKGGEKITTGASGIR